MTCPLQSVTGVSQSAANVRYVLTEAENMVVDGVVASVHSTAAGSFETAPFRFVDYMWRGALQSKPIAAALSIVLESPVLSKSFCTSLSRQMRRLKAHMLRIRALDSR
jgi:hypothetical protein